MCRKSRNTFLIPRMSTMWRNLRTTFNLEITHLPSSSSRTFQVHWLDFIRVNTNTTTWPSRCTRDELLYNRCDTWSIYCISTFPYLLSFTDTIILPLWTWTTRLEIESFIPLCKILGAGMKAEHNISFPQVQKTVLFYHHLKFIFKLFF